MLTKVMRFLSICFCPWGLAMDKILTCRFAHPPHQRACSIFPFLISRKNAYYKSGIMGRCGRKQIWEGEVIAVC